ncbi:MAG: acyl-CoA dehydrogenase family protein [Sedimentisphaerales bacterium]|nr:acyl-CoA dehydrogenase family protein [Sedimentisphaerales bacterium]
MPNFYTDNDDIRFLFKHIDLGVLASLCEEDFKFASQFDYAPASAAEAIRNYALVLDSLGRLSAEFIAPRAEQTDREGNTLNPDGTVSYAKGIAESLDKLAKADCLGFTLPHRFGGLNFPNLVYSMAIEIVSRADASLMNIFGLQGIAETINAFADEQIKQKYLHDFSAGKVTGAMVLTEPDAGSDLQAVKLRAFQDNTGNWFLHGVKRFITNGCGEVLLVLARSEPDRSGGLGLSLFVCDRGPTVHIRRLEDKLGIHGSPTCEIFFDNTPSRLIGERQRGLVTYVMALMNGARIGIAGQSLGIAEAAYRVARDYAASRKQFGVAIEKLPAVRDMLIDMKIALEAGRALLYETSRVVDHNIAVEKKLEFNPPAEKEQLKPLKEQSRRLNRLASMLTPMSKYFCSEMANRVAYDSIQVLGGSGYMRDYAVERHARDARITTIYEGTSQLQIVAAVRGVCSGACEKYLADLTQQSYDPELEDLIAKLAEGTEQLKNAVAFVKQQGAEYMDLYGRPLVDIAINLIIGYLFCDQASSKVALEVLIEDMAGATNGQKILMKKRKALIARRFITKNAPQIVALSQLICSGDKSAFTDFAALIGPVPEQQ